MACDLEPWHGKTPLTAENVANVFLKERPAAYFAYVEVTKASEPKDGKIDYEFKTLKQYAGKPQDAVEAVTDTNNSCYLPTKVGYRFLIHIAEKSMKPYPVYIYNADFFSLPEEELVAYLDKKQASGKTK